MKTLNKVLIGLCIILIASAFVCGVIWGAEREQGLQRYDNGILGWVAFFSAIAAVIVGIGGAFVEYKIEKANPETMQVN